MRPSPFKGGTTRRGREPEFLRRCKTKARPSSGTRSGAANQMCCLVSRARLHRPLKKSIVECFEGAQLQLRRCKSFVLSSRGGLQADEGSASRLFQQPLQPAAQLNQVVAGVLLIRRHSSAGVDSLHPSVWASMWEGNRQSERLTAKSRFCGTEDHSPAPPSASFRSTSRKVLKRNYPRWFCLGRRHRNSDVGDLSERLSVKFQISAELLERELDLRS